jgi:GT2 family glycosyltransferase
MEGNNNRRCNENLILSIIILTYNSVNYIDNCLKSIYKNIEDIKFEAIVVDSGSTDGTLDILKRQRPNLNVILLDRNYGTAYSRNIAIRKARGNYLLFLDSDTVILRGAIKELINTFKKIPDAGIVAPRLLYPDGTVQKSCKLFPNFQLKILKFIPFLERLGEKMELYKDYVYSKNFRKVISVDYCISACWLVKREVLDRVGLFDGNIFYAPEDVDMCIRMWLNGYKVVYNPNAEVIHYSQRASRRSLRKAFIHLKGLLYYFRKYHYVFDRRKIYNEIMKKFSTSYRTEKRLV